MQKMLLKIQKREKNNVENINKIKWDELSQKQKEQQKGWIENNKEQLKEYREKNKEKKKQKDKEYRERNKEKIKEYREKNKEKIKKRVKEWREKNKEHLKEYGKNHVRPNYEELQLKKKEIVICECGATSNKGHIARHRKTKKHQSFISSNI